MRILVTAASRHGSTEEIARAIGAELVNRGLEATVAPVDHVSSIERYVPPPTRGLTRGPRILVSNVITGLPTSGAVRD